MLPLLLLAMAAPPEPVVESAILPIETQWNILPGCPRVVTLTGNASSATGVTIGLKDGFAYVLSAQHATPGIDDREVQFFTKDSYPDPAKKFRGVEVVAKWEDPDLALLKVTVGSEPITVIPLASVGQRPKRFPFDAISVGCSLGAPPTFRAERVVAKRTASRPSGNVSFFWELSASPVKGRSGGPLLDAQGRVIGICAAGRDNRGYYTHTDEILAALKEDGFGWLWAPGR